MHRTSLLHYRRHIQANPILLSDGYYQRRPPFAAEFTYSHGNILLLLISPTEHYAYDIYLRLDFEV